MNIITTKYKSMYSKYYDHFHFFTTCTLQQVFPYDRILAPCNYCHHPWCVGHKSYHKALVIMFGCDGISDHASWNEVFHYWDAKLSWFKKCVIKSIDPNLWESQKWSLGTSLLTSSLQEVIWTTIKTPIPSRRQWARNIIISRPARQTEATVTQCAHRGVTLLSGTYLSFYLT